MRLGDPASWPTSNALFLLLHRRDSRCCPLDPDHAPLVLVHLVVRPPARREAGAFPGVAGCVKGGVKGLWGFSPFLLDMHTYTHAHARASLDAPGRVLGGWMDG